MQFDLCNRSTPAQVEAEEKSREQIDITEHQAAYELIRNRNIEDDHQMRCERGEMHCVR